ncbi:unnamed protein product, partial [marine sediment metagenome]
LEPDERLLLWTLKHEPTGNLLGIFPLYRDAIELHAGINGGAFEEAMKGLESSYWVAREGPLVWIRNQLRHDPYYTLTDENKIKGAVRILKGLPRYFIVRYFRNYYGLPADDSLPASPSEGATGWLTKGLGKGPAKGMGKPPEDKYSETVLRKQASASGGATPAPSKPLPPPAPEPKTRPSDGAHFQSWLDEDERKELLELTTAVMDKYPAHWPRLQQLMRGWFQTRPPWPVASRAMKHLVQHDADNPVGYAIQIM